MKVLAAMSGGVDSSVAAAMLLEQGHEVVGVTMKLWGGESDTGCCSVSDVDDARRSAQQLDIEHLVFNFGDDFERTVVRPYVDAHARGRTPNPCIECNRHLKFDRLLVRAQALGFDAIATGHHARRVEVEGRSRVARGADRAKDQSYVLHMLREPQLRQVLLPIGALTKAEVRDRAARLGLRTAAKPDSQDVCFITSTGGREAFLGARIPLGPGRVVAADGRDVGEVERLELVTVGQRKGLGVGGASSPRYVLDVDVDAERRRVVVGSRDDLLASTTDVVDVVWPDEAPLPAGHGFLTVEAQCSAHGTPHTATIRWRSADRLAVHWSTPQVRVAPGQSVVFYDGDVVLGGGIAA